MFNDKLRRLIIMILNNRKIKKIICLVLCLCTVFANIKISYASNEKAGDSASLMDRLASIKTSDLLSPVES